VVDANETLPTDKHVTKHVFVELEVVLDVFHGVRSRTHLHDGVVTVAETPDGEREALTAGWSDVENFAARAGDPALDPVGQRGETFVAEVRSINEGKFVLSHQKRAPSSGFGSLVGTLGAITVPT
jgi:hypothetical protein